MIPGLSPQLGVKVELVVFGESGVHGLKHLRRRVGVDSPVPLSPLEMLALGHSAVRSRELVLPLVKALEGPRLARRGRALPDVADLPAEGRSAVDDLLQDDQLRVEARHQPKAFHDRVEIQDVRVGDAV